MVSIAIQIDLGSSPQGNGMIEFYRLYITEINKFKLVDCSGTVHLFL
jgi:hypothetical protein